MAVVLDRNTLAVTDTREVVVGVGSARTLTLGVCPTVEARDELRRFFDTGRHGELEVRETTPKIHTRYDLVFRYVGNDIVFAELGGVTDAALWCEIVGQESLVPALPEITQGEQRVPSSGSVTLMDHLDPRANRQTEVA
jgi:hypothetical protein